MLEDNKQHYEKSDLGKTKTILIDTLQAVVPSGWLSVGKKSVVQCKGHTNRCLTLRFV